MSVMETAKQTAFRFTSTDLAIFDVLQRKLGIGNRTDIIRLAIRTLAEKHNAWPEEPKPRKKR